MRDPPLPQLPSSLRDAQQRAHVRNRELFTGGNRAPGEDGEACGDRGTRVRWWAVGEMGLTCAGDVDVEDGEVRSAGVVHVRMELIQSPV